MEVNNTSYTQAAAASTTSVAPAEPAAVQEQAAVSSQATEIKDVYEPSATDTQASKVNTSDIRRMMEEANRQTEALRDMIKKLINRQAGKEALGSAPIFNENGEKMFEVDEETRRKAQEDIAEGGYYSVENTGDRILSFAEAIAGNNPEMLEKMRSAVQEGFAAAEEQWGGKLPQISQDTYDYVMKGFDERVANAIGQSQQ